MSKVFQSNHGIRLRWQKFNHTDPYTNKSSVIVTLDNESFVTAWQNCDWIEEFMDMTNPNGALDQREWQARARRKARALRQRGVNLRYLPSINSDVDALNQIVKEIG
jgi:hypothetical protein